jgi:hypothetical protein
MPDQPSPAPPPLPEPGGRPYGPNTPAVRRFLQRFAALRPAEWEQAARRYEAQQHTAPLAAADRALGQAVERAGRTAERDAVVGPLVQLVRDAPLAPNAVEAEGLSLLPQVAEAALAALLALVVRDLLPARAFDALYAPFAELIPPDALGAPPGDPAADPAAGPGPA